jgi:hypothetical protein
MSNKRVYLVSISARSTLQIWLAATSEDAAIRRAESLWADDESVFTKADRAIDCTTVLESQEVQS